MVRDLRESFNRVFKEDLYAALLDGLAEGLTEIPFRVAETPVFIPAGLQKKLIKAGNELIAVIRRPDFKALTEGAVPDVWRVPGENDHPHFLTFDFAVCRDMQGELVPKLIELQGFPSLYGFQLHLADCFKRVYDLDAGLCPFFNGFDLHRYTALLREVIVGDLDPREVALMDVEVQGQKTLVDFLLTQRLLGIPVLSASEIFREGRALFYVNGQGVRIQLKRIYNRLIFDELEASGAATGDADAGVPAGRGIPAGMGFDPREELDVEWITHPNWFYRISKYTMPFLKGEFVPETHFLHELKSIPADLEHFVLKPLFSFAGAGVRIDVTPEDIRAVQDPQNWILQRKVEYAPAVHSPEGGVKVEIRLMYLWPDGGEPQLCLNLARLSRGKMIGVNYNRDFNWVGGTVGLMQRSHLPETH